ncbi:hypothetical protein LQE93_12900 [Clostridium sp. NSJ-145]|uniref:hypothetical protein n=1 Tax=Clostridium sp. NSJ-145 TaxID=2897777 RepID=UPI001E587AD2|nr:hypothetical protein [Clostridium sp. NSJ-145]MCD2502674.1 hypothetical protein [Clostridium sp. NSJ-145]
MIINKLLLSRKEVNTFLEVIGDSMINHEFVKYFLDIDKDRLIKYNLFFNKIEDAFENEDISTIEIELSLDVNKELKYIIYNYIKRNIAKIYKEEISEIMDIIESLDSVRVTEIDDMMTYRM